MNKEVLFNWNRRESTMKITALPILLIIMIPIGCADISRELSGSARPDSGITAEIPPVKTFNTTFERTWHAVLGNLDEHAILYDADKSSGKIVTEEKGLQTISGWRAMFAGSNYKVKQFIDIKKVNETTTSVLYRARFTKEFATIFVTANKEYPETENLMRKTFFEEIDKRLAGGSVSIPKRTENVVPGKSPQEFETEAKPIVNNKVSNEKSIANPKGTSSMTSQLAEPEKDRQPLTPAQTRNESSSLSMTTKQVQQRLSKLGYQPGPADGKIGKRTINALKKFQQDNDLPITGKADNETVNKLPRNTVEDNREPDPSPRTPKAEAPRKSEPVKARSISDL
jgi:hypothetical protein